mmetsp:Transcript_5785/g.8239  ORF Transcript_5785/g.8239 Transcript_5785/m.8239 type:complete len:231 (+) Transcript_5785:804-1496(+)
MQHGRVQRSFILGKRKGCLFCPNHGDSCIKVAQQHVEVTHTLVHSLLSNCLHQQDATNTVLRSFQVFTIRPVGRRPAFRFGSNHRFIFANDAIGGTNAHDRILVFPQDPRGAFMRSIRSKQKKMIFSHYAFIIIVFVRNATSSKFQVPPRKKSTPFFDRITSLGTTSTNHLNLCSCTQCFSYSCLDGLHQFVCVAIINVRGGEPRRVDGDGNFEIAQDIIFVKGIGHRGR